MQLQKERIDKTREIFNQSIVKVGLLAPGDFDGWFVVASSYEGKSLIGGGGDGVDMGTLWRMGKTGNTATVGMWAGMFPRSWCCCSAV